VIHNAILCGQRLQTIRDLWEEVNPVAQSTYKQAGISFEEFIEASSGAVMRALAARRRDAPGEEGEPFLGTVTIGISFRPEQRPEPRQLDVRAETADLSIEPRALALAAGDIHGALMRELLAYFKLPEYERTKRAQDALGQLRSKGLVTDKESAYLTTILDTIHNVNMTDPQIAEQVSKAYQELKSASAGSVALAIAGIAVDSTQTEARRAVEEGRADRIGDGPIANADVEGAIIGAAIGAGAGVIFEPVFLQCVEAGALGGAVGASVTTALIG
jgi:hypothetical protein